jgi:hypothetical protein
MNREYYNYNFYNLHELKILLKIEVDVNKIKNIKLALDKKIKDSQQKLLVKEILNPEENLFNRMMAEAEGIKNIRIDEIDKPFYDMNDNNFNKKTLGKRKDLF